jgi:hypothetical protein
VIVAPQPPGVPGLSLNEYECFTALAAFLNGVLPPGTQVFKAQANRVPEPLGSDFVVMTPIRQTRLETNETTYQDNTVVGSVAPMSSNFTGSITLGQAISPSPSVLAVTSVARGAVVIGAPLAAAGVLPGTIVTGQISGTTNGVGFYYVNLPQTLVGATFTQNYGILSVASVTRGVVPLGALLLDTTGEVAPNTTIIDFLTGIGGAGDYMVSPSQALASETLYLGQRSDLVATEWTVQIDVHGPGSSDNVRVIDSLFRSEYAVDTVGAFGSAMSPLYAEEARQMPFDNAEQQVEFRWTMDLHLQISPVVTTPQQFFDQIEVTGVEVDASFPPA